MYPARAKDPADLTAARQLIDQNLASWLAVSPTDPATTTTPTPQADSAHVYVLSSIIAVVVIVFYLQ